MLQFKGPSQSFAHPKGGTTGVLNDLIFIYTGYR